MTVAHEDHRPSSTTTLKGGAAYIIWARKKGLGISQECTEGVVDILLSKLHPALPAFPLHIHVNTFQ
ncbi:hypothetical protein E2562_025864 [Oryza meyeriana var. granulata]|uniref:Uncharacterized protein n=1 Tax=Oryza meyeriana var. granulata TaxID=110450 RepID=A0A6G1C0T1_9ORYZ|nr:hypothetical protein E2562_025864 [Oryza meyeriana var. granulata]